MTRSRPRSGSDSDSGSGSPARGSRVTVFVARLKAWVADVPDRLSATGTEISEMTAARSSLARWFVGAPVNTLLTGTAMMLVAFRFGAVTLWRFARSWWRVFKQPTVGDSLAVMREEFSRGRRERVPPRSERGASSSPTPASGERGPGEGTGDRDERSSSSGTSTGEGVGDSE